MPFVLALAATAAAAVILALKGKAAAQGGKTTMVPIVDNLDIKGALRAGIVAPEGLPEVAVDILYFHAARETGNFKAWYFAGPQKDGLPPTYNLYNRRKGSGRGEWTGQVKMVGGDDIRIYTDVRQSARDFRQWLGDLGKSGALPALRAGDGGAYFLELERLGFSAKKGDYLAYADQWRRTA